ncbi:MAG: dienelactone hydrolase family protein [Terrimicrobiaceae bacterium]|nr:dienelactone hydrolase family protein [Terrimicrobiaceae bacterium]
MARPHGVEIPAGPLFLEGELAVPPEAEGLVIFAHGSGSSHLSRRNQFVARVLRESGNGTLLADLLTRREEADDARTGYLRFDIQFLAERLELMTQWCLQHSELSELRLGYFGSSTGGAAALVAAAKSGAEIEAVVSRGGRPDLAAGALPYVKAATLLIVGERDDLVLDLNRRALAMLACEKKLVTVPGATHLFEEPGALEEVARLAADWFRQHLTEED